MGLQQTERNCTPPTNPLFVLNVIKGMVIKGMVAVEYKGSRRRGGRDKGDRGEGKRESATVPNTQRWRQTSPRFNRDEMMNNNKLNFYTGWRHQKNHYYHPNQSMTRYHLLNSGISWIDRRVRPRTIFQEWKNFHHPSNPTFPRKDLGKLMKPKSEEKEVHLRGRPPIPSHVTKKPFAYWSTKQKTQLTSENRIKYSGIWTARASCWTTEQQ